MDEPTKLLLSNKKVYMRTKLEFEKEFLGFMIVQISWPHSLSRNADFKKIF